MQKKCERTKYHRQIAIAFKQICIDMYGDGCGCCCSISCMSNGV